MQKQSMIILYVIDQERSKRFYEAVLQEKAILHVPGMTELELTGNFKLGLMQESGIASILEPFMPHPQRGRGIPRCELYLYVDDPENALRRAVTAGAKEISKSQMRNWGDTVAYCADPDGHIIAFAK